MLRCDSRLHEYTVSLNVFLLAHDEEEALAITKLIKQAIERGQYEVAVDIDKLEEV